jgi:hypothetical protein
MVGETALWSMIGGAVVTALFKGLQAIHNHKTHDEETVL